MLSNHPVSIFISYHLKDESLFEELNKHLAIQERNNSITILDKTKILPGQETHEKISEYLEKANIILLLISSDFLATQSLEVTRATELHAEKKALVIPVLLRHVDWEFHPFDTLSPLPSDKTFLPSDRFKQDEAFAKIAKGIKDKAKKFNINLEHPLSDETLVDKDCQNQVTKLINDADHLFKDEKLEQAAVKYLEALKLNSNSVRAHISLGNVLSEQNKHKEAIDEYRKAISLNYNNAESHFGLGFALYENNKIDEAIKELKEALHIDSDFSLAHLLLKILLLKQDKLEEVKLKEFANFVSKNDQLTQSLIKRMSNKNKAIMKGLLAIFLYKQNNLEDTVQKCREAINILKTQKNDLKTTRILANFYFWLGKGLQDLDRLEEAIVEYRQAAYLNSSHIEARFCLALALSRQGQFEKAIDEYHRVLRLNPKDAKVYNQLGIALYKQGNFEEAINQYRTAIHYHPDDGRFYNNLGLALIEKGEFKEAVKQLNKAVLFEPNNTVFIDNLKVAENNEKGLLRRLFSW